MKRIVPLIIVLTLITTLSSCMSAPFKPAQIDTVKAQDFNSNQVIIVGSIRFNPEILYEKHYDPKTLQPGDAEIVQANDPLLSFYISKDIGILKEDKVQFLHFSKQNDTFIIKTTQAKVQYLRGFNLYINDGYAASNMDSLFVSVNAAEYTGRFKITVPNDEKAIYIGTFEIECNAAYEPIGYKIIDEYDTAKAIISAKFPGQKLVRADIISLQAK